MDNLEPWNMFTNDFIAEETDEIFAGDLMNEYQLEPNAVQDIKAEPLDYDEIHLHNLIEPMVKKERHSPIPQYDNASIDNTDDDTIFNFAFDSQFQLLPNKKTTSTATVYEDDISDSSTDTPINFEAAIVYICPACGLEFDTQSTWKRHLNRVHQYNTRHGLNFRQVDRLYHKCLECNKSIAMHAMENLLKHKFTHLPYRCTKCKLCLRQYKYRQDLMVHLRTLHREDLIDQSRNDSELVRYKGSRLDSITTSNLEIGDIQENAIDIFDNTSGITEVKSEPLDTFEDSNNTINDESQYKSLTQLSLWENSLSRSPSRVSDQQSTDDSNDEELYEKYICYLCPQCGAKCTNQKGWRKHIENVHGYGTRRGLNFINVGQYFACLECDKEMDGSKVHYLQLHKFTHLPFKYWMRCKVCAQSFARKNDIVSHLTKKHKIGVETVYEECPNDITACIGVENYMTSHYRRLSEADSFEPLKDKRDVYEAHIYYLCPQCGKKFQEKKFWRTHIVNVHCFNELAVLNFTVINDRQVKCLECDKIITNAYGIQNAQQHRITHLPFKAFIRCRLCTKSYTDRKGLVKHLHAVHSIGDESDMLIEQLPRARLSPPPSKRLKMIEKPQKEIVRYANSVYEISFLDEINDDSDENMVDDDALVPELMFDSDLMLTSNFKCTDCASIFPTQSKLDAHVRQEHDFIDLNNSSSMPELPTAQSLNSDSNWNIHCDSKTKRSINEGSCSRPLNKSRDNFIEELKTYERYSCHLCPACGEEFKVQYEWRRHINEVHNFDKRSFLNFKLIGKYSYKCTICNDVIINSKLKALQDHKFRHLPYKLYLKCLLCGVCYNHKPNMQTHLKVRHSVEEKRFTEYRPIDRVGGVGVDAYPTGKPSGLNTAEDCISFHNAVDHPTITYHCPQCNMEFDTHVFWRKHIVDEHKFNNREGLNFRQIDQHHFLCLECYKRVTVTHTKGAIGQLQSHKFRHLPFKSFRCTMCKSEFVRKQMFFKHLNKATDRCDCVSSESLSAAVANPTADDINLSDDAELDLNASTATDVNDTENENDEPMESNDSVNAIERMCFFVICPECGARFETWRPWREHINIEHSLGKRENLHFRRVNKSLNECFECGELVNGNKLRDLQTHKFKHLPYNDYLQCKLCNVSYHHVANIKNHLRQKHLQGNDVKATDVNGDVTDIIQNREVNEKMMSAVNDDYDDATLN